MDLHEMMLNLIGRTKWPSIESANRFNQGWANQYGVPGQYGNAAKNDERIGNNERYERNDLLRMTNEQMKNVGMEKQDVTMEDLMKALREMEQYRNMQLLQGRVMGTPPLQSF